MQFRFVFIFLLASLVSSAQKITYSEADNDDSRQMDFEIIGKLGNNIAVYKTYRDNHYIAIYDNEMKQLSKTKVADMPDKVINADFINYSNQAYFIYQYQRKNIVYCNAITIDASGNKVGNSIELDTTKINFLASNRIYNINYSEDKQRIGVYKINSESSKQYFLTTLVFDAQLKQLNKHRTAIDMPDRNDFLSEFIVDNDGDISFIRASGVNNNINKLQLFIKPLVADSLAMYELINVNNVFVDEIKVKADNKNKRILVTSFYSKLRRGNVEGLFNTVFAKADGQILVNSTTVFNEELRSDARGENSLKMAFNDYYLRNIVMRADGGFIMAAEAAYQTTRGGNNFNRWNYGFGTFGATPGYYNWGPYGSYYPWGRNQYYNNTGTTRYYADNILVTSFDPTGKLEWSNIVRKSQYDDNSDNFIGYNMLITSGELHFVFNQQEKRNLILTEQIIAPNGDITRKPTLKNLDKGYEFMPRLGKQIASRTLIIPCQYRNYICFAKVEL